MERIKNFVAQLKIKNNFIIIDQNVFEKHKNTMLLIEKYNKTITPKFKEMLIESTIACMPDTHMILEEILTGILKFIDKEEAIEALESELSKYLITEENNLRGIKTVNKKTEKGVKIKQLIEHEYQVTKYLINNIDKIQEDIIELRDYVQRMRAQLANKFHQLKDEENLQKLKDMNVITCQVPTRKQMERLEEPSESMKLKKKYPIPDIKIENAKLKRSEKMKNIPQLIVEKLAEAQSNLLPSSPCPESISDSVFYDQIQNNESTSKSVNSSPNWSEVIENLTTDINMNPKSSNRKESVKEGGIIIKIPEELIAYENDIPEKPKVRLAEKDPKKVPVIDKTNIPSAIELQKIHRKYSKVTEDPKSPEELAAYWELHFKLAPYRIPRKPTPMEQHHHDMFMAAGQIPFGTPNRKHRYPSPFKHLKCIWNVTIIVMYLMINILIAESKFPMVCQTHTRSVSYSLPHRIMCAYITPRTNRLPYEVYAMIYKDNLEQYEVKAVKCHKSILIIRTWVGFFTVKTYKEITEEQGDMTVSECERMKRWSQCNEGILENKAGYRATGNEPDSEAIYGKGGIKCCHWVTTRIINCNR